VKIMNTVEVTWEKQMVPRKEGGAGRRCLDIHSHDYNSGK
jgi:hypothetical protein